MKVRELTARGPGGVSVLELRGEGASELLGALASSRTVPSRGSVSLMRLEVDGEALDEALVWFESAERVELHVHGSPPLVNALLARLGALGASKVEGRATLESRAAELLSSADCDAAARILLDQSQGALRRDLEALVALEDRAEIEPRLERLRAAGRVAQFALTPTRVALVGEVNAGKSTLFNALLGADRSIVSAHAGATRDALIERAQFGEWPVELIDTAGERELAGDAAEVGLERAGQRLGRTLRESAQWTVRLVPVDGALAAARADEREARIASRVDLVERPPPGFDAAISVVRDSDAAVRTIHELFHRVFELPRAAWSSGVAAPFDAPSREAVQAALGELRGGGVGWRAPLAALLRRAD